MERVAFWLMQGIAKSSPSTILLGQAVWLSVINPLNAKVRVLLCRMRHYCGGLLRFVGMFQLVIVDRQTNYMAWRDGAFRWIYANGLSPRPKRYPASTVVGCFVAVKNGFQTAMLACRKPKHSTFSRTLHY